MLSKFKFVDDKYQLFTLDAKGKWRQWLPSKSSISQIEAEQHIKYLKDLKRGWIGKRKFPIKKVKLVKETIVECIEISKTVVEDQRTMLI